MRISSGENRSSGTVTSPALVAGVVFGTYCVTLAILLALYYSLNIGLLAPTTITRYRADPAFTLSVFASVMIARGVVSPNFKQTWVFVCCWLAAMLISCVSVLLQRADSDFIDWYAGPLWTGLWGGFALMMVCVQRGRYPQLPDVADAIPPNHAVKRSRQSRRT